MISRLRLRRLLGGPALPGDVRARLIGSPAGGTRAEPGVPEPDRPTTPDPDPGGCTCTDTCACTPEGTAGR